MKAFFKTVAAVVAGMFIFAICSILFFTCTMAGLLVSSSSDIVTTQPGDVLFMKINGEVTEVPVESPMSLLSDYGSSTMPLRGYLSAIDMAKQDPNITGIYLNTDGMSASPATLEALHDAISDFRSSGKWVVSYNDNYTLGQYYLASSADSVFVNTVGAVALDGLSQELVYPKALLDKLGIEMQIFRVGSFKSAVEPFMIEHISDENRLQTETYLRSIWNQMAADMALSRGMSVDAINALADQAVGYMKSEELAQTGLVDGLRYRTEVEEVILKLTGKDHLQGITAADLVNSASFTSIPAYGVDRIAVVYAAGEIYDDANDGISLEDGIFPSALIKDIRTVADDSSIKAVVLRVNSPGGSAFASEQIWKALSDLKLKKPLVVSMGDYAASGGYYISCLGDYIVAEPTTLTGSIGVFGMIPNFSGLTSDKLGVNFEEVKTHSYSSLSPFRSVTRSERLKVQNSVENTYDLFTRRCAEGRGLSQDSIKTIGGGRVWTGADALKIGLVDSLGGLDVALKKAAELANLAEGGYERVEYPQSKDSFDAFMDMLFGPVSSGPSVSSRIYEKLSGNSAMDDSVLRFIENLRNANQIQARSFDVVVL